MVGTLAVAAGLITAGIIMGITVLLLFLYYSHILIYWSIGMGSVMITVAGIIFIVVIIYIVKRIGIRAYRFIRQYI
jgi:hypothetical protein